MDSTIRGLFNVLGIAEKAEPCIAVYAHCTPDECRKAGLTENQVIAVKVYTSIVCASVLNAKLRGGRTRGLMNFCGVLDMAIALRPRSTVGPLYRGMDSTPPPFTVVDPTQVIVLRGFSSFSTDMRIASNFAGLGAVGCILHLRPMPGFGSDVSDISSVDGESEVLFNRGTTVVVDAVIIVDGVRHIYLRQVPSTIGFATVILS